MTPAQLLKLTPKMSEALSRLASLTSMNNAGQWFNPQRIKTNAVCMLALVERGLVLARVQNGTYQFQLRRDGVTKVPAEEKVAGTLAISTNGKGEIVIGFNIREMLVNKKGEGHVVMSKKQCGNLCYLLAKHMRIASTEPSGWLGKSVGFEGEEGEGSVAFRGKITKEDATRVYVKCSKKGESGWYLKSYLEDQE